MNKKEKKFSSKFPHPEENKIKFVPGKLKAYILINISVRLLPNELPEAGTLPNTQHDFAASGV